MNIGDQVSQVLGIFYPHRIDSHVKYVRSQKFYGRYMDDWYLMNPNKEKLLDILSHIREIAKEYGIYLNEKKTRIVKNGELPYENVESMFRSWMGDFYKLMSRQQRKNMLKLFEDLFDKTIMIVNKKMIIVDRSSLQLIGA